MQLVQLAGGGGGGGGGQHSRIKNLVTWLIKLLIMETKLRVI